MMLDHGIPAMFENVFLQTKSYIKLIKSRWLKYTAIQIHLSQIVHGDEALKISLRTNYFLIILTYYFLLKIKQHTLFILKDK